MAEKGTTNRLSLPIANRTRCGTMSPTYPTDPLAERSLDDLGTHYIVSDEDGKAARVFTRLYFAGRSHFGQLKSEPYRT